MAASEYAWNRWTFGPATSVKVLATKGVRDAVRCFGPLMVRGGRMIFDDVILCNGARVAFDETIGAERAGELHDGMVRF